jgi:putative ABC transport system permease protein
VFHGIRLWLRVLTRADTLEDDMHEEMREHLDRAAERYVDAGMSAREARRAARNEFGDIDRIRDEARAARQGRSAMERVITNLRQTIRRLAHEWRFTTAVLLVLAIGIGPTAAISSVVYEILIKPLAYRSPEQLGLTRITLGQLREHPGLSLGEILDLRRADIFERVEAEARLDEASLGTAPDLVPLLRIGVTTGMFDMLGVKPIVGRGFAESDIFNPPQLPPGTPPSARPQPPPFRVLLDYDAWKTHFGGAHDVVGKIVQLNGGPAEIIGVMPDGFRLVTGRAVPQRVDVYFPIRLTEFRNYWGQPTLVRLKPGMTFAEAEVRLAAVARTMKSEHKEIYPGELRFSVTPLLDDMTRTAKPAFRAAAAAVFLLFVIAFANATALVVARVKTRDIDIAVRTALGAGRGTLIAESIYESVVLATAGAATGAMLAVLATAGIRRMLPRTVPRWDQIAVGWEQVLYAAGFSLVGLIVLGLIPAWKVSRSANFSILRSGSVQGGRASGTTSRLVLVGMQMMLTVVLGFGCVQLARSAMSLRHVDLGYDPNVLTLQVSYDRGRFRTDTARAELYQRIRDRVSRVPGVSSAGVVTHIPLSGSTMTDGYEANLGKEPGFEQTANYQGVTPGYFKTLEMTFVEGRDFTDAEDAGTQPVIVVDESLVRTVFPKEKHVIGKTLRLGWGLRNAQIVGVVRHARTIEVSREVRPQIYAPIGNLFSSTGIIVARSNGDVSLLANSIVAAINEVGPGRAVSKVAMLTDNVAAATSTLRAVTGLVTALTVCAGLLSAVGLYLIMAYTIHQQRRATAIRAALGATPRRVMWEHCRVSGLVALVALPIGALLSMGLAPFFSDLVYRVGNRDPVSLSLAIAIAAIAGMAGTYVPLRRAANANILNSLREM